MSVHLEHDYIGLSEVSAMESSEKINGLNLKATELRLGLPGSDSPDRDDEKNGYDFGLQKSLISGAKRVFSDAINGGSGKWVFSGGNGGAGSEIDLSEGGGGGRLFAGVGGLEAAVKPKEVHEKKPQVSATVAKAQIVGWPPIRSFRKNSMASHPPKNDDDAEVKGLECMYVKVSMDGAPFLRKVDLKTYGSYMELYSALEKMFSCFTIRQCGSHGVPSRDGLSESCLMDLLHGSEYVLTYEDKDGDWMLVGDVPWEMFTDSCKRLRIMRSSDAIGLAPRVMEKCKNRS